MLNKHDNHVIFGQNPTMSFSAFLFSIMILSLLTIGCPNQIANLQTDMDAWEGTSLVQYGEFVYRIGGCDSEGKATAEIYRASLSTLEGPWEAVGLLPEPRAHAFAFAAGNMLYVVGGEDNNGPESTVYYTLIDASTGDLGFSGGNWETSARPLPYPLSRAAGIIFDGRIFLAGGLTTTGVTTSALDTIIQARIFQDGQVSHWYRSKQTLRTPASLSGVAVLNDRLYVAGGRGPHGDSSLVTSFGIGQYGKLTDRINEPTLPVSLVSPFGVDDGQDLLLLGGEHAGDYSPVAYTLGQDGLWIENSGVSAALLASTGFRENGRVLYLKHLGQDESPLLVSLDGLNLGPGMPVFHPGSGLIAATATRPAKLSISTETGMTLRYRLLGISENFPSELTEADSLYSGNLTIGTPQRLALQAFSAGGKKSALVKREYTVKAGGGFATLSGTVPVDEASAPMQNIKMEEWLYGGSTIPVEKLWYRLRIEAGDTYRSLALTLADADTRESTYTGRVFLSLFETDMFTHVLSSDGEPIYKMNSTQEQPLLLNLQAGEYYLFIESRNGIPDEGTPAYTFGISVVKAP